MRKILSLLLTLCLLCGLAVPALADVNTLEGALSSFLGEQSAFRFSATMQAKTLSPFNDETLAMLNNVLKHVNLNVRIEEDGDASVTALQIAVDENELLTLSERTQEGVNTLEASLLPNRVLTSNSASPMELLTASEPKLTTEHVEGTSASQIAEAFSVLNAIDEAEQCYRALTDGIAPYATEKGANYKIKGVGKAKWVRLAKLTAEQSDVLAKELRAVLACGMDADYRAELEQVTFAKGLTVALYRASEGGDDIAVYIKGSLVYPDGGKRNLSYQWAFAQSGDKRVDTYKYEVSKASGKPSDSRTIAASVARTAAASAYTLQCDVETSLKRSTVTDTQTVVVDLEGQTSTDGAATCVGKVSQALAQTAGGETVKYTDQADVELKRTPDTDGAVLSGTVKLQNLQDKKVYGELELLLAENAPQTFAASAPDASLYSVADESTTSSIDQNVEDSAGSDFLVGAPPTGLTAYQTPDAMTSVDLDGADDAQKDELMNEIAQRLAGKMLPLLAGLPDEDGALLKDGMTDEDYAAFLALLN